MPTYKFKDNNTGEEFEKWMLMAEREPYLADNPHLTQMPTLMNAVSEVGSWQNKCDGDWKSFINRVSKIPNSNVEGI